MSQQYAIDTHQLRKEFGKKVAVRGLDLQVRQGEVFGFLGPNGAGKTTSIKMLLGLVHPTGGSARILDHPISDPEVRMQIGFLPEHFRFHDWLTAAEFLTLHGHLFRLSANALPGRINELLDLVGLTPFRENLLRTFSKGMLQRIGLAQALLNHPDLIFLDEPTSGLDPVGRRLVRDIIRDLRGQGATVFLNSHLLSEVEITCDRVAFLKQGEVLQTNELASFSEDQIQLAIMAKGVTDAVLSNLSSWGKDIRIDGERISMLVQDESCLPAINRFLVEQGVDVYSFTPLKTSLEEQFIQIVGVDGGL
jgi:ABC-2 type transport system ATP-binding protein